MPPRRDSLLELFLSRLVERNGFANWLGQRAAKALRPAFEDAQAMVAKYFRDGVTARDNAQRRTFRRMASLYADLAVVAQDGARSAGKVAEDSLKDFAQLEHDLARVEMTRYGIELAPSALGPELASAIARLPVQGLELGEWWTQTGANIARRYKQQLVTGLALGEGPAKLARRVGPSLPTDASEGGVTAWRVARREIMTVSRTATTAVYNASTMDAYKASGVVTALVIRATLDARTSDICRAKDSTEVPLDKAEPGSTVPPLHLNCRSTTEPVIDYASVGLAKPPNIGGQSWKSYAQWFGEQPEATQDGILGAERAALVRSGRATLRDLVDDDLRTISLSELRARYKELSR